MSAISFKAKLIKIGTWTILHLPLSASSKLPSRGMTMVEGTINGQSFKQPLEPDGKGSHWFKMSPALLKAAKASAGDTVSVSISSTKDWIAPEIPEDFLKELEKHPQIKELWDTVTLNAQWDWIRWIRSTKNEETRKHRIEVAFSKLKKGMRRPCCFNRNMCTEPYVSHNWVLAAADYS